MSNNNGGDEIVCSTGELMNLKCLSHSAVEMRALQQNNEFLAESWGPRRGSLFCSTGNNNQYANHQRSQSFDASIGKGSPAAKSNLFSGLLNRFKVGVGSSVAAATFSITPNATNDMMDGSSGSSSNHATAPPTTPVSTSATLIVDSSGCGIGPTITTLSPTPSTTPKGSQDRSPVAGSVVGGEAGKKGKGGIPWDNNTGYFLDASVLGLAIENHLKKGDNKGKRRATFCTLSETNSQLQPSTAGGGSGATLGAQNNRPRSASAYSVLPFFHSSGGGPVATGDPDLISRRRESIASAFPSVISGGFFQNQGRRNSSFNPNNDAAGSCSPNDSEFYPPQQPPPPEEVIVGSFIKTSMTSELYSEGEVIMEEEQLDIENYDRQIPQNIKDLQKEPEQKNSSTSFLGGMDFWTKKPTETIINLFSNNNSNPADYIRGTSKGDGRFSFSSQRGSVATINEEEEDEQPHLNPQPNTICGFLRNIIRQIINSFFRS